MATKKKSKKVLAGLGGKKKTKAAKAVSDKAMTSQVQRGYTVREYKRWRKEWKQVPGCPECVRQGRAKDGFWALAIFHPDADGLLVSHVAYPTRAERDAFAAAIVFLSQEAERAPIRRQYAVLRHK